MNERPEMSPIRLAEISRCFQGVIPSIVATADLNGIPNVTYVSQIFLVDDRHVALSCQFFNKTRRNLDVNPRACAEIYDPLTFQPYRLRLKFLRSETSGALFDAMSVRIQAIASLTGMAGVFKLIAADILEVEAVEQVEGFLSHPLAEDAGDEVSLDGWRGELRGLQWVSERINQATTLESLLEGVLQALDEFFDFRHTMILLHEEATRRLVTIASRGYGESGVGAEVPVGEGLIGTAARERQVIRISNLDAGLRYSRAIRRELEKSGGAVTPEIPLPGLPDAQSVVVIPLLLCDRVVGVLVAESSDPMKFADWHEAYLEVIGNQIALGIDRMIDAEEEASASVTALPPAPVSVVPARKRTLTYYANDDCVFVDGEYLIRSVPGRILWKLMREWEREGRTEFSNRELRLDQSLGLPAVKDNLESRLILLRKRLEEKCPDIRLASTGRGRFALQLGASVDLVER
jgi:adenylate cyclase